MMIEKRIKELNKILKQVVKANPEIFRDFDIKEIETIFKGAGKIFKITIKGME